MQAWLVALCAIQFDVEQGQLLDAIFPSDSLTPSEESHVAFSSFPDSAPVTLDLISSKLARSSHVHDSIFFFRIPRTGTSSSFLYGYVFNRHRQDEKLKRGGEHKSVVILSHLPCWGIFRHLVQIAGPLFFDVGAQAFETIAASVSRWPFPKHGSPVELPVINKMIIRATLPSFQSLPTALQQQLVEETSSQAAPGAGTGLFHEVLLYGLLKGVLMELWSLWELALIGEPILVIAPTPMISSQAVAAICNLITPLPCSVDFRPYFTIHDPGLSTLIMSSTPPSIILGVTNPYFVKSLSKSFPNVLSLQDQPPSSRPQQQQNRVLQFLSRSSNKAHQNQKQVQRLWSSYKPASKPDVTILNRLMIEDSQAMSPRTDESMDFVNSEILRRHFVELTTNFLSPLAPYHRAAAPARNTSPFADPPPLPGFDPGSFLASLAERGPGKFLSKRLRSNWIELYSRFLKGPNFLPWFEARRAAAEKEQQRLWRNARAKVDVRFLITNMSELHLVDTFHAIMRHILAERQMNSSTADKLKMDLRLVFNGLPKDMQQLLLLNPQHAALLQVQFRRSSSSGSGESIKLPGRPSIHVSYMSETSGFTSGSLGVSVRLAQELASDPLDLNKS